MIYITGDIHGDINEFKSRDVKKIKKKDTLIICGDFGFVWENSKQEQKNINWLSKRKYNILFVEGCNENYGILEKYPVIDFAGGKVRQISDNIFQLVKGEVFELENKLFFAFGGGSISSEENEKYDKVWGRQLPTQEQAQSGLNNLLKVDNKVDYIITHDAPFKIAGIISEKFQDTVLNRYFENIAKHCDFKQWYFGKYHLDKTIPTLYQCVFKKVLEIK